MCTRGYALYVCMYVCVCAFVCVYFNQSLYELVQEVFSILGFEYVDFLFYGPSLYIII